MSMGRRGGVAETHRDRVRTGRRGSNGSGFVLGLTEARWAAKFEWPGAPRWAVWMWIPLALIVAGPLPLIQAPLLERGAPIFWLLTGGWLMVAALMARASWPFALLFVWAGLRTFWMGIQVDPVSLLAGAAVMEAGRARPVQLLVLWAMAGLCYWAARDLPERAARLAGWAALLGGAVEVGFGYLNLWQWYPWMTVVVPDQVGRPMGFLTHPNYWGSYIALCLPLAWALGGILPAVALYAMTAATVSGGPIIAASAGALLLAWPQLGRRLRWLAAGGAGVTVAGVMTAHEWRLSGRWEVWQAILPEALRYPWIGQGLGSWRIWADHYNQKIQKVGWATLQAHNEPYQLWFELGAVGVLIAALWGAQALLAARRAWRLHPAPSRPWWTPGCVPLERAWVAMLAVAAVNSLGSPVFHLPGQAALILLALGRTQAAAAAEPPEFIPGRSGRAKGGP